MSRRSLQWADLDEHNEEEEEQEPCTENNADCVTINERQANDAILMYPSYGTVPLENGIDPAVFNALVRARVLCKKIEGLDKDAHASIWNSILESTFTQTWLRGASRISDIEPEIFQRVLRSHTDSILLLVLCGHGSKHGFVLVEGEILSTQELIRMTTGYKGTVVIVLMHCYAEPSPTNNILHRIQGVPKNNGRVIVINACGHCCVLSPYINKFMKALHYVTTESITPMATYLNMDVMMNRIWKRLFGVDDDGYKGFVSTYPTDINGPILRPACKWEKVSHYRRVSLVIVSLIATVSLVAGHVAIQAYRCTVDVRSASLGSRSADR